jgi:hypothetical protein
MDCYTVLESKISDEARQDDWLFCLDQQSDYYQSKRFHQVAVCAKKQFYL